MTEIPASLAEREAMAFLLERAAHVQGRADAVGREALARASVQLVEGDRVTYANGKFLVSQPNQEAHG
jgi:hypothetical protein